MSSTTWSAAPASQQRTLDAAQWGAMASVKLAYAARPFVVIAAGANLMQNGTLLSPGASWLFWSLFPAAGGTIRFGSCNPGCADFSPGSTSDFLMSNPLRMVSTADANLYHLRVRAQGIAAGTALTMGVRRLGSARAGADGSARRQCCRDIERGSEALFNATSNDLARLNMTGLAAKALRIRDVVLEPLSAYQLFVLGRESALLVNETAVAKSVDCPVAAVRTCAVVGLDGQAVVRPVTLAANGSKVVVSGDGKWRR